MHRISQFINIVLDLLRRFQTDTTICPCCQQDTRTLFAQLKVSTTNLIFSAHHDSPVCDICYNKQANRFNEATV